MRKARAYKISDEAYSAAMKRCGKEKNTLAGLVEYFVTSYGEGYNFLRGKKGEIFESPKEITSFKLDEVSVMPDGSHEIGVSEMSVGFPENKNILDPRTEFDVNVSYGGRGHSKTQKTQTWIESQIKAINAEKIPKERNTQLGRQSWKKEQQKRIGELKKQLK